VRIGRLRIEAKRGFKFIHRLFRLAFVFQSQREVVVSKRVVGFKIEGVAVTGDGFIPGFGARRLKRSLTVLVGSLCEGRLSDREAERQDEHPSVSL
jgi:hypothetical protein